ncbi:DUF3311 domain-containing protein [Actinacidiphila reveromycinica]|uniref:DUF3311 domain-containing protein n=1 Tax=Actinacidiphila reveromycinica TaxID=659352 RepID=UPI00192277A9|nr:DUF3311 domain-containing protein [Streptomyces sp. SN-593]
MPVVTPARVVAGICLLIPLVSTLWVSTYSRLTPTFIGMPFFYWYQLAWVPVSAALTYTAYVLVRRDARSRKGGAGK